MRRQPHFIPGRGFQPLRAVLFRLTRKAKACILPRVMENQTANIDLSALDTEAMRSRLSELGSYL